MWKVVPLFQKAWANSPICFINSFSIFLDPGENTGPLEALTFLVGALPDEGELFADCLRLRHSASLLE